MNIALFYILSQTSALEILEAKPDDGIFAGTDKLIGSAELKKGKSTKAPTTLLPTGPTPAPTLKVKKGKSGKATIAPTPGFVISSANKSFTIVSCDPSSVEVAGSRVVEIKTGNILISTPHATDTCTSCNQLFRRSNLSVPLQLLVILFWQPHISQSLISDMLA